MLDWLRQTLAGGPKPDGAAPAVWIKRLKSRLDLVQERTYLNPRKGLNDDIFRYVLSGEGAQIIAEVSSSSLLSSALHVDGYDFAASLSDDDLYQHFDEVGDSIALRWLELLHAAYQGAGRPQIFVVPADLQWIDAVVLHACTLRDTHTSNLTLAKLDHLATHYGHPPGTLLRAAFASPVDSSWHAAGTLQAVIRLSDFGTKAAQALQDPAQPLHPYLLPASVKQRQHVLNLLATTPVAALGHAVPALVEHACTSSRSVRQAALNLLKHHQAAALAPLRDLAGSGKPDQRQQALRLMHSFASDLADTQAITTAIDLAQNDRAESVQALVAEWQSLAVAEIQQDPPPEISMPEVTWADPANYPSTQCLNSLIDTINQGIETSNQQRREFERRLRAEGRSYKSVQDPLYTKEQRKALIAFMQSERCVLQGTGHRHAHVFTHVLPSLLACVREYRLNLYATLKMLEFFGLLTETWGNNEKKQRLLDRNGVQAINAVYNDRAGDPTQPTLLLLSKLLQDMGLEEESILRAYCISWGQRLAADWSDAAVWPYFAHQQSLLVSMLTGTNCPRGYYFERQHLFQAVATLPTPPAAVIDALFDIALGAGKSERLLAQQALHRLADKETRIMTALADGKSEVRAAAANWLARLKYQPALKALAAAVRKEKHDVAKSAMLNALQALGESVHTYLDRDKLPQEAEKLLAKGLPKDMDWFPLQVMPSVRWADNGQALDTSVLTWLLAQAVKNKSAEPGALLIQYCQLFEPRDREAFGQFVLEAWLQEDTRAISYDEAQALAMDQAQTMHAWMQRSPHYASNSPLFGKSVTELTAHFLPNYLNQPAGSAIGSKGLLAVVAACAAERAAAPVQRYLKQWYGTRAAQGKALIAMLAWIEHPSATQLMLSVGSRFRTKSFQEEATRQAEALAERKGWTLAELADRTIPSAGFDESGELSLNYGPRSFTAKLQADFSIELLNPEGKPIKALPEPRADDDAEQAKDAKKAFSQAKKDLKGIVTLQTERLYEALCTERGWPYADWQLYLQQHPVMRHLLQRLVWIAQEPVPAAEGLGEGEGGEHLVPSVAIAFRPLDDGTLTDVDDEPVTPSSQALIRLAHDSLLEPAQVQAWLQHLQDYEIKPLFQQLGKGVYRLPAEQSKQDVIKDFEGHLLETFALRTKATKLGYARGDTQDAGWFFSYVKRFPTLNLVAVIEFTGNGLPEENRTVALLSLHFNRSGDDSGGGWGDAARLPLKQVPQVLLSECYQDFKAIAAVGTGYDADWQKKSEY